MSIVLESVSGQRSAVSGQRSAVALYPRGLQPVCCGSLLPSCPSSSWRRLASIAGKPGAFTAADPPCCVPAAQPCSCHCSPPWPTERTGPADDDTPANTPANTDRWEREDHGKLDQSRWRPPGIQPHPLPEKRDQRLDLRGCQPHFRQPELRRGCHQRHAPGLRDDLPLRRRDHLAGAASPRQVERRLRWLGCMVFHG